MAEKSLLQKEIKKHVIAQLEKSLVELKDMLGEKKFNNRIKKASKLLVEGIGKAQNEETAEVEKPKSETNGSVKKPVEKVPSKKKSAEKKPVVAATKKSTKNIATAKKAVTKKAIVQKK